jgi:K+-sensing histidine kinase KdpD
MNLDWKSFTLADRRLARSIRTLSIGLGCAAFAIAVRVFLEPLLGNRAPYIMFVPAVMLSAWYSGLASSLLTTALSALYVLYFLLEPRQSWMVSSLADRVGLLVFLSIAAIVAVMCDRHRRTLSRAKNNQEQRETNHELQQFVSAASHDLREPLHTMKLCSELLGQKYASILDSEGVDLLQYVSANAARTQMLVDDFLQLSSIQATAPAALRPVSISSVLEQALTSLRAALITSGAVIETSDLPVVMGNEQELVRLLQNLIANAVKYHRADEPSRISISAKRLDSVWRIAIQDNGRGFRPEYAAQIFEPFKRLHGHAVSGSGLGLAICKRIVDQHDGRIWAESQENVGSTFFVELSAAKIGAPASLVKKPGVTVS